MFSLLIAITYLAFISLGLPDSLLGSGWPTMYVELGVSVSLQGVISMIIAGCTIISCLSADFLIKKFHSGLVTATSVLLTAVALLGFSFCNKFWQLCLCAIPYGLGAGAVDAALNNYAAINFSSKHLNWLHCFWGVGASVSPYIMGACLSGGLGWHMGYRTVGFIQMGITAILFCSLPLWKKFDTTHADTLETLEQTAPTKKIHPLLICGVWQTLVLFFADCSAEAVAMYWASSYLTLFRNVDATTAANFAALFYLGMTLGRFISGCFSNKLGDKLLIRAGCIVMAVGVVLIALPLSTNVLALIGLVVFGTGCGPIYPAVIHLTPQRFGKENSQAIVGLQMASAYVGTTFMPPLFGLCAEVSYWMYPAFLCVFLVLLFVMSEWLNSIMYKKSQQSLTQN